MIQLGMYPTSNLIKTRVVQLPSPCRSYQWGSHALRGLHQVCHADSSPDPWQEHSPTLLHWVAPNHCAVQPWSPHIICAHTGTSPPLHCTVTILQTYVAPIPTTPRHSPDLSLNSQCCHMPCSLKQKEKAPARGGCGEPGNSNCYYRWNNVESSSQVRARELHINPQGLHIACRPSVGES